MSWAGLKHQKQAVAILRRSLEQERLAHAYLFVADDIAQAEALARELAKTVNCEKRRDEACDHCRACQKILEDHHPDVRWLYPESKSRRIVIEQIRELEQPLYLAPGEGRTKVAILAEAERLQPEAANAFLKTLEEPPAHSLILLLTMEPQRLLDTITSRCLRVMLAATPSAELSPRQREALNEFAKMLETADLAAAYRFLGWWTKELGVVREEVAQRLVEQWQLERYKEVNPEWVKEKEEELEAAIAAEYVRERRRLLVPLEHWLRDVLLCSVAAGEKLLTYGAQAARAKKLARRLSPAAARACLEAWEELQEQLARNVNEALALEVAVLKAVTGRSWEQPAHE